jgi:peptidoglycan/LPS O-acetylase OafA/YrhL
MGLLYKYAWPKTYKGHILLICIFGAMSIAQFALNTLPFQLHRTMEFLFWFYMGMQFEKYRKAITKRNYTTAFFLRGAVLFAFLFISFYILNIVIENSLFSGWFVALIKLFKMALRYLMEGTACIVIFLLAFSLKYKHSKLKDWVGNRSFQIYLYHVPCVTLYTWIVLKIVSVSMMTNILFLVLVVCKFLVGLLGPALIDFLVRKIVLALEISTGKKSTSGNGKLRNR